MLWVLSLANLGYFESQTLTGAAADRCRPQDGALTPDSAFQAQLLGQYSSSACVH